MSKNIVVFSDGTGQEGGKKHNTNIYKMFNMLEDRTDRQVIFYDRGLGTGWRKLTGNIGGMGISRNIKDCYKFIFDNFKAGDQIFLFGFSRGAATVRSLSSFIHYFGILPKSRPELIKKAYKIYKCRTIHVRILPAFTSQAVSKFKFNTSMIRQIKDIYRDEKDKKRKELADKFIAKHHTMWTRIKLIGCFDTVAALGLPFKTASAILDGIPFFRHKFHNFRLSESVENAYQALAIDDERKTFHPVLWDMQKFDHQENIEQVWFAGMHTDVGGGYKEHEISDITLVWMIQKAVKHGLLVFPDHKVEIREDPDGYMHDSRGSLFTKLYRKKVRFWPKDRKDKPIVHASVLKRNKNKNNKKDPPYHPWILDLDYKTEPWIPYNKQKWYNKTKSTKKNKGK